MQHPQHISVVFVIDKTDDDDGVISFPIEEHFILQILLCQL